MSTNYMTSALTATMGAFLLVVSQAFRPHVLGWVAFGVAIGVVAIVLVAQLDRARGGVQRVLDAGTVAVAALLIAFAVTASGSAVTWLTFAFSLGLAALAVA